MLQVLRLIQGLPMYTEYISKYHKLTTQGGSVLELLEDWRPYGPGKLNTFCFLYCSLINVHPVLFLCFCLTCKKNHLCFN